MNINENTMNSLQACAQENQQKDIGNIDVSTNEVIGEIKSDEKRVCQNLRNMLGNSTTRLKNLKL